MDSANKKYEVRLSVRFSVGTEAITTFEHRAESPAAADAKARAKAAQKNMTVLSTLGIWWKK